MRKIRQLVILLIIGVMMVGMLGGTFFNLMSRAKTNEQKAKEKEELLKQVEEEQKELQYLSFESLDYETFFTYLAYKGLPILNPIQSKLENPDGDYSSQAHWQDGRYDMLADMDSFGPGGWIEIFDAEEQVISRMDQLKNWGYTNFIQKGKILFYFDLEVEQNVIHEYEGAINEYENTTISQIES